ncbi:unnamed protein product [Protopolystoma xenopodis]|uniref:Uncharacterized protein n=1 Tax=Protopolystoma xenopodis TaxID=117903 RepID=A0A3S5B6H5_9PLAT|nr:unnamed protein product [Protopolystoma xenopodis]
MRTFKFSIINIIIISSAKDLGNRVVNISLRGPSVRLLFHPPHSTTSISSITFPLFLHTIPLLNQFHSRASASFSSAGEDELVDSIVGCDFLVRPNQAIRVPAARTKPASSPSGSIQENL